MTIKNKITAILLLASASFYGQESIVKQDSVVKKEVKISYLDSIKATFVNDELASCIDSLWMKDLASLDYYDEMTSDIKNVDVDQKVDFELPTELLKERLKKLDEKSPFNIEYNVGLENVIKSFLKNRKRTFERLLGISQFYFPMFEEELAKNNIPLEIKYLAVVESALNPRAVSRVGATGLWQFMYQTGKQYGLNIDSYVDERSEPLKASQAASQYMNNMYKIFGDWDLVLASYNSGPGNVAKAIRRSGGQQNYWNIRKNLPKETQGYLPAFLATMYIFEYHKEHGIVPNKAIANLFATDTVMIKKHMTFKQVSDLLDVPLAEIQFFNPSFKRNEIPHISGKETYLRLPKDKIAVFTSNEDKVYAYVDYEASKRERPNERLAVVRQKDSLNVYKANRDVVSNTRFHKVHKGDSLNEIALKYDVSVADLKKWNKLKGDNIGLGDNLKIVKNEKVTTIVRKEVKQSINDKNEAVAVVDHKNSKLDKAKKEEKVDTTSDSENYHVVAKGESIFSIAKKNNVTVQNIKEWNNLIDNNVKVGTQLIISGESLAEAREEEARPKSEFKDIEHVVEKGEYLGTIARKYNVSVNNLLEWNALSDTNIKLGDKLIVGKEEVKNTPIDKKSKKESYAINNKDSKENLYKVRKGDTLLKISQKFPGVTIADIKKWNNIKGESIKPGMKLKING